MDVREQLLNVAQDLIQRHGIDAVSFRTIADEVGIKSASVHYHFPTKDNLILELTTRYTSNFGAALSEIEASKTKAHTRLRSLVELFRTTNAEEKICYCATLAIIATRLADKPQHAARTFFVELRNWVERVLHEGLANEEFELTLPVPVLARAFTATLEGALLIDHLEEANANLDSSRKLIESILKG